VSAYYYCKLCDIRWRGDCWCENCGKVSKADTSHYGTSNEESPMPTEKWTKHEHGQKAKYSQIKRGKYRR